MAAVAGEIVETTAVRRTDAASLDLAARVWILELRREAIIEIGGTSRAGDIWQCVRRRIESGKITDRRNPVSLPPGEAAAVKRKARDLVAGYAAAGLLTVT